MKIYAEYYDTENKNNINETIKELIFEISNKLLRISFSQDAKGNIVYNYDFAKNMNNRNLLGAQNSALVNASFGEALKSFGKVFITNL